jgi:hypothetical protein
MPPIAQRLREPAAFVLLAFGALSTLFHTITFLFGPGYNGGSSFSDRAGIEVTMLLSVEVTAAVVGAVWLAHVQSHLKLAKVITLTALITLGVMDLFGVVALFSSFGANQAPAIDTNGALFGTGWGKTQTFFIALGELAVAGVGSWLVLGYFQQYQPAKPVGGFQQPQWGPPPQQQQWQQQAPQQQVPPQQAPQQQPWGPPPQQAPQQQVPQQQPPQPQWGQPQPQQDADSMMTQAIPTVPPAPQGQQQQPPQQQIPPQQDGGLGIGNWTAE